MQQLCVCCVCGTNWQQTGCKLDAVHVTVTLTHYAPITQRVRGASNVWQGSKLLHMWGKEGRGREGACPSPFVRLTFCIIKSVAACRQLRTEVDSSRVAVDCCQRLKLPQRGHRMQCILSSSSCQCSVMQQAER